MTPPGPSPAACACTAPTTNLPWHDTHCGPREQVWLDAGYRVRWVKDARIPAPLVTTGPAASNGVPGTPGTSTLFGGEDVNFGTFKGLLLDAGCGSIAVTPRRRGQRVLLRHQSVTDTFASDAAGNPIITRPFIDALTLRR